MKFDSINVADLLSKGSKSQRYDIQTNAAGLKLSIAFKGPILANDILHAGTDNNLQQALANAVDGKIMVTYSNGLDKPTIMVPNKPFSDVLEILASAQGGMIHFEHVADFANSDATLAYSTYIAHCYMPFTAGGSLRLGQNHVILEYSSFSDNAIAVGSTVKCGAVVDMYVDVSPSYTDQVLEIEELAVVSGSTVNFDVKRRPLMFIPSDGTLDRVQLSNATGIGLDMDTSEADNYIRLKTPPVWNVFGLIDVSYSWAPLPLAGFTSGSVTLNAGSTVYFISSTPIS